MKQSRPSLSGVPVSGGVPAWLGMEGANCQVAEPADLAGSSYHMSYDAHFSNRDPHGVLRLEGTGGQTPTISWSPLVWIGWPILLVLRVFAL